MVSSQFSSAVKIANAALIYVDITGIKIVFVQYSSVVFLVSFFCFIHRRVRPYRAEITRRTVYAAPTDGVYGDETTMNAMETGIRVAVGVVIIVVDIVAVC